MAHHQRRARQKLRQNTLFWCTFGQIDPQEPLVEPHHHPTAFCTPNHRAPILAHLDQEATAQWRSQAFVSKLSTGVRAKKFAWLIPSAAWRRPCGATLALFVFLQDKIASWPTWSAMKGCLPELDNSSLLSASGTWTADCQECRLQGRVERYNRWTLHLRKNY